MLGSAKSPPLGRAILVAWVLLTAILLLGSWSRIAAGHLPDPDDALRLVQVRDLIAGQGWFDLTQYRIDPPGGVPMHWSRLVDLPLLLAITLVGETAALVAVPLLTLAVTLWVVGQSASRLIGTDKVLHACLVCGFLPVLVTQLQPLRIDHHGWQIAMVALAALALTGGDARRGGVLAGMAMAIGLAISVEMLPLSAAFGAVLAWRWWRDPRTAAWLASYLQALAAGLPVLFLVSRGLADRAPWCDALSPPHLVFVVVVAAGVTLAERVRLAGFAALAALAASGALGLAVFGGWAPRCMAPPFADLDPLVRDYWYVNIKEGQPVWRQAASWSVPALVPVLAALGTCLVLWLRTPPRQRAIWVEQAVLLGAALAQGLLVSRSLAFAAVLAAVPLGWLLAVLLEQLRFARSTAGKLASVAVITFLLAPAAPVMLAQQLFPPSQSAVPVKLADAACNVRTTAASLSHLPAGVVFAPLDLGPAILLESKHAVIATSHHRAEAAMADVIGAFIAPPDRARAIVARHRADYLALCTDLAEARIYARRHPEGLAAHLIAGRVPDWLEPLGPLSTEQFKVFRIKPGGSAAQPR